jgi:predicted dehydrogenase
MGTSPVRLGILGAARIAPMALIRPAREVPEAQVVAVAARDPRRAERFASRHGIPRVHPSYEALLADPEVDAVYNPLPNSLHCEWSIRALRAAKHVLCEKPFAANAAEAERMAEAARESGRVLAEAFHYRYHPLAARMKAIATSGELGAIRHVEAHFCIPLVIPGDIRYRYDLAGGATMDVGSYTVSLLRFLAGAEPEDVTRAEARLSGPQVDRYMEAELRFPNGVTGRVVHSLFSSVLLRARAEVRGERGRMRVINPIAPQLFYRLKVETPEGARSERVAGGASYTHQLRAFVQAVSGESSMPTDAAEGVANMRVIDAIYEKAGLKRRGT